MPGRKKAWTVRLAAVAENDFQEIVRWTKSRFGEQQARAYAETLTAALDELSAGPCILGVRERQDIGQGLFTRHVAQMGRKARHFILFRVVQSSGEDVIDVLRILHDAMDVSRHCPDDI